MNESNLINIASRPEHERQRIARSGGKASGVARGARKLLKESLSEILTDEDTQRKVCEALVKRAAKGDVRAFAELRHTLGEDAAEKVEIFRGEDRAVFIEEHAEQLRGLIAQEIESGERGVTDLIGLTYEERLRLIRDGMNYE